MKTHHLDQNRGERGQDIMSSHRKGMNYREDRAGYGIIDERGSNYNIHKTKKTEYTGRPKGIRDKIERRETSVPNSGNSARQRRPVPHKLDEDKEISVPAIESKNRDERKEKGESGCDFQVIDASNIPVEIFEEDPDARDCSRHVVEKPRSFTKSGKEVFISMEEVSKPPKDSSGKMTYSLESDLVPSGGSKARSREPSASSYSSEEEEEEDMPVSSEIREMLGIQENKSTDKRKLPLEKDSLGNGDDEDPIPEELSKDVEDDPSSISSQEPSDISEQEEEEENPKEQYSEKDKLLDDDPSLEGFSEDEDGKEGHNEGEPMEVYDPSLEGFSEEGDVEEEARKDIEEDVEEDAEEDVEEDAGEDVEDAVEDAVEEDVEKDIEEDVEKDIEEDVEKDIEEDVEKDIEEDVEKDIEDHSSVMEESDGLDSSEEELEDSSEEEEDEDDADNNRKRWKAEIEAEAAALRDIDYGEKSRSGTDAKKIAYDRHVKSYMEHEIISALCARLGPEFGPEDIPPEKIQSIMKTVKERLTISPEDFSLFVHVIFCKIVEILIARAKGYNRAKSQKRKQSGRGSIGTPISDEVMKTLQNKLKSLVGNGNPDAYIVRNYKILFTQTVGPIYRYNSKPYLATEFAKVLMILDSYDVRSLEISPMAVKITQEMWDSIDVESWYRKTAEEQGAGFDEDMLNLAKETLSKEDYLRESWLSTNRYGRESLLRCALSGLSIFPGDYVIPVKILQTRGLREQGKLVGNKPFRKSDIKDVEDGRIDLLFHCYLDQFLTEAQRSGDEDPPEDYDMQQRAITIISQLLNSAYILSNSRDPAYYRAQANSLVEACRIPIYKICSDTAKVKHFFTRELTKDSQFELIAKMYWQIKKAGLYLSSVLDIGTKDDVWK